MYERLLSNEGEGTTAELLLTKVTIKTHTEQPGLPSAIDFSALCVLLIEDNEMVAKTLVKLLRKTVQEVVWVASTDEAQEHLSANAEVDVVLSDINLPGVLNGVELADWILPRFPSIAVLLMSGNAALHTSDCAHTILSKPFAKQDLLLALEDAVSRVVHDGR